MPLQCDTIQTLNRHKMNKRNLQIITFILAIVPTITGLIGLTGISDPIYGELSKSNNILLDSNLRFFSGVWLGLGIALFSIIKTIDKQTQVFRIIWGCIFLGGFGRLLSIMFLHIPPLSFTGFTILEIVGAPFFIYWQNKISTTR
jgi:Domain of unknown function (DUF4345)